MVLWRSMNSRTFADALAYLFRPRPQAKDAPAAKAVPLRKPPHKV